MKISYSVGDESIEKDIDSASFMVANKIGGYGFFSDSVTSRYHGFFVQEDLELFRVIEDITPLDHGDIVEIRNAIYMSARGYSSGLAEGFFMPDNMNVLAYELSCESEVEITLDVKKSYDNRNFGRNYHVEVEEDKIIVQFIKRTNINEDESEGHEEYVFYLVIKTENTTHRVMDEWCKREYLDDKKRKSMPYERYVYSALRVKGRQFVFSASKDRSKAIKDADSVFNNMIKLKESKKASLDKLIAENEFIKKISDKETKIAYLCAMNSLAGLRVKTKREEGIYAGLPWFFQLWARDELISLNAALSLDQRKFVKNILMRYFFDLKTADLPSKHPSEGGISSDAIGWLYLRTDEAMKKRVFSKVESDKIRIILEENIKFLLKGPTENGFSVCKEKGTWMDSLSRDGATIELQALRLQMYKFMYRISQDHYYKDIKNELREKVREKFWNGKYLIDSLTDPKIRCNLFIAAYAYPKLLDESQWKTCFDNVLPKLFLDWGGVSTLDKTDASFVSKNTGENPMSYHNGDSWFWINNMAAIVLNRFDKEKYSSYVTKIFNASKTEILYSGIMGCAAEISSASKLESNGCLNQAWSNAMFIELVEEIFG